MIVKMLLVTMILSLCFEKVIVLYKYIPRYLQKIVLFFQNNLRLKLGLVWNKGIVETRLAISFFSFETAWLYYSKIFQIFKIKNFFLIYNFFSIVVAIGCKAHVQMLKMCKDK